MEVRFLSLLSKSSLPTQFWEMKTETTPTHPWVGPSLSPIHLPRDNCFLLVDEYSSQACWYNFIIYVSTNNIQHYYTLYDIFIVVSFFLLFDHSLDLPFSSITLSPTSFTPPHSEITGIWMGWASPIFFLHPWRVQDAILRKLDSLKDTLSNLDLSHTNNSDHRQFPL